MMTAKSRSSKLTALALLLLMLVGSVVAFPHSMLGSAGREPGTFTIAGQTRACSEYADETGAFSGSKLITSKQSPALVNVYYVNENGGWTYYSEYEIKAGSNSLQFTGGTRKYAYEVYYCPEQSATCKDGQTRAVTETTFQVCKAGTWGTTQKCDAGLGQYFSPQAGKCVSTTCMERWNCGTWGACTSKGVQFRTCTDANSCGTYRDMPKSQQSCTPTPSAGSTINNGQVSAGTSRDMIRLAGQPKLDAYTGEAGEARTVTQTFTVTQPGQYWIEAGIESLRQFSVADVEQNTCNPEETWYANELVAFERAGEVVRTFKVTPKADGEYVLHTAIVTGCAGDVVDQINAADHLVIGNPENGEQTLKGQLTGHPGALVIIAGLVVAVIGGIVYWRKR